MAENQKLDLATETLIQIIHDTAAVHAPFKQRKKKTKRKMPWVNTELTKKISTKNKLLQDSYMTKNKFLKKRVTVEQNQITTMKRNLKATYYKKEFQQAGTDPTKLWYLYNSLIGKQPPVEETEPECMNQSKADNYNKFFAEIGEKLVDQPGFRTPKPTASTKNFVFKNETISNIEKLIDSLQEKTATGFDEINIKLIKDAKKEISPIICKLINLGYNINAFPSCLKHAIIKPIFKKDNKNDISNYRPIAILPALSKIFERSASNQLVEFLEKNQLLSKAQHAYRKLHGTNTCLVETINHIHQALDNKQHAALISLDLSKAFDCLNHQLLLQKLENLGLEKTSLSWMTSYLTNRVQVTKFQHFTSTQATPKTGVPQGSILGPLLFICFTNDLPESFEQLGKIQAYADDTQILVTAKTIPDLKSKILSAINTAQKWFKNNSMKINADKTKFLIFNTSPETKTVEIEVTDENGTYTLKPKDHIEILGIFIDNELNWKKQIKRIKRNAMGKIRNLHRVNHFLSQKHRINLYNAIISPQFDYGDILYGGCNQKESQSLQRIQNFAMRSILGKKRKFSAKKCRTELKFLTLEQRRNIHYTVFIHKALMGQSSKNLEEQIKNYIPTIRTRNASKNKLIIPSHNTSKFRKSPLFKMISAWNETPSNLPKDNVKLHKQHYQKYLIQQSYPD